MLELPASTASASVAAAAAAAADDDDDGGDGDENDVLLCRSDQTFLARTASRERK